MDEQQITDEIAAITDILQQRLGRRSRWNGVVELSDIVGNNGKALWDGSVSIDQGLAQTDLRWRTMIHESLHHFSAGLTPTTYFDLSGWEEGVAEQLQRILRSEILFSLGVNSASSVFETVEIDHEFNRYIDALESMRLSLIIPAADFYETLLATSLKDRPASLMELGHAMKSHEFHAFQRIFASAFSRLRGG